jgi:hypothetical protein
MNLAGLAGEAVACAACEAVKRAYLGELSSLAEADSLISAAVSKFFESQGPQIASTMAPHIEAMTKKAVEVIRPSVEQALKEYTPTFAAISGGMLALSVLLGTYVAKREFRKARGRRRAS